MHVLIRSVEVRGFCIFVVVLLRPRAVHSDHIADSLIVSFDTSMLLHFVVLLSVVCCLDIFVGADGSRT